MRTKTDGHRVLQVVYIAGRFRGATAWDIEQNVRAAETVALEVARAGAMPLCPHANTRFFHGQLTEQFWLNGTLSLLARCDAVVLVPGWEASEGARVEVEFAREHGIPVLCVEQLSKTELPLDAQRDDSGRLLMSLPEDELEKVAIPSEEEIKAAFARGKRALDAAAEATGSTAPDPGLKFKEGT